MTHFDSMRGWVSPEDEYVSETGASLKSVMAALRSAERGPGELASDIYDAVELLLYKYALFVRQGIREDVTGHKGVSWYLTEDVSGRAFISYQEGPAGEWLNDCYADEVPLWLLLALFRRIQRRKPLGDAEADETIKTIQRADLDYIDYKEKLESEATRGLTLSTIPHRLNAGGEHGRG